MSVEGYVALRFNAESLILVENLHIVRRMMNRYMQKEGGCKVLNVQKHPNSTNEEPKTLIIINYKNTLKGHNKLFFGAKEGKLQEFCNFDFEFSGLSFVHSNFQFYKDMF
jgi:ribosomal protein L16/L10AE